MPKRKANWWPASILADPDVLSVDDEGRFVLCKICHVHYAVHGGKKPKPVIMNSNFRTRAWDVHKERTNSHRMQKQQEAEQQQKQQAAPPKEPPKPSTDGDAAPKDGVESQAAASRPPESGAGKGKAAGKRSATMGAGGAPSPRRRVFRSGATTAETARRPVAGHERHSFLSPAAERKTPAENEGGGGGGAAASTKQAEGLMRWRHMHDDVSRALSAAPRKRQTGTYTSGEMRAAKTLAQTETGDFGGNNSDKVAKKLRSLNTEYHAKAMRPADAFCDRPSASYKEYWGTLRDVYTSGTGTTSSRKKSVASSKQPREENKETVEVDSTTPDESGCSSEDVFKPLVVVHDAALIHAVERLTETTSRQLVGLHAKEASGTREALAGLTSVMTDLRVQHGNAFRRMIELQEKHLKVMEGLLQLKLRKEAARNASSNVVSAEKNANEAARDARE
ncbi:hypothetical protein BBJ28_00004462 [Nothophytophthora sp. Chile5]|nr:hypothetical protein BBJ28_00004462 [Nothophytophthora sp. Chile5]